MKTLTAKQEARLEKKKKKMAALAEMVKLNDNDRLARTGSSTRSYSSCSDRSDGCTKKTDARDIEVPEPKAKRAKYRSDGDLQNVDDPAFAKDTKGYNNSIVKVCGNLNSGEGAPKEKLALTEEQYVQLKRELNERKRQLRHGPKLRFKIPGDQASLAVHDYSRTPIFLTDIQNLLLAIMIGSGSPCFPSRWCHLERASKLSHCVVLIVEGLSVFHFVSHRTKFSECNRIFDNQLEIVMPPHKEGNIIEGLSAVPLTSSQKEELIQHYGSLEAAIEIKKDPILMVKTVFPVDNWDERQAMECKYMEEGDKFPRTQLLLSALQMVDEGYPLPLRGELAMRYKHYKFTKDRYTHVTATSPMYGLDCEMCKTSAGFNELTRIAIVDENLKPLYDTLVRPTNRIIDYLTAYSGITPEMMLNVTKTLEEVQEDIREILPSDAILVGQSLNSDLHAMRMMHPYVIDTSVIFNIAGERRRKTKLQTLAQIFLGEEIQMSAHGHNPTEDSQASIKLTKLKLSQGVDFGDVILKGRKMANDHLKQKEIANNIFGYATKTDKRTAIVTSKEMSLDTEKLFKSKVRIISDEKTENSVPEFGIDWHSAKGNKSIVRKTQEIAHDYFLTITNFGVAPKKMNTQEVEKTISNVDRSISKIWDCVGHNGLFVVLLGGANESSSGVAMVKVKRSPETISDPITV